MTIRPGESWGERVPVPGDLVDIATDAELADQVAAAAPESIRLVGGDLLRTLGGGTRRRELQRFPIDVLRVNADGQALVAVAHVVVRGATWWRGPITAVMNVDHLGHWDVAPRAHPNDGRADVVVVDGSMGLRARWQAWRRLPAGTHVPHPLIRSSRARDVSWEFDPPRRLWLDGVARGPVRSLAVVVEPDGAVVHI